jgi:hypothetical protein
VAGGRRDARREERSSDGTNHGWRRAQEMRKKIGVGSDPGRDEAARRRSGGVGRGRERGERGREGRSGAVAQRQRGDAGRGNECAEAPERMVGSAPGTAGRAPGAEESSSPGSSK